jgi:hypothetical protein
VPDHDPVIAALVNCLNVAGKRRGATFQPRSSNPARKRERRRYRLTPPTREVPGEILLPVGENVDGEPRGAVDGASGSCLLPHAEKNEWRIERERGERVRGHRASRPIDVERDDRDPGDKVADGLAECS